jgi:CRP-like cAMP-binding protein
LIFKADSGATTNRLLALLTDEERKRLLPELRPVKLNQGDLIFDADEPVEQVCFPDIGMISIVSISEDGESVEIGMVGYEGAAGLSVVLGDGHPRNRRAVVQISGAGRMINAGALRQEFNRCGRFQEVMLLYAQAYLTVIPQSVFCQAFHKLEERLARWLVECQFRARSNEFHLTQEYMAEMIGVRRAGVTEAIGRLEAREIIKHRRSTVTIIDQEKLEASACECCRIIRSEFDRLFGR